MQEGGFHSQELLLGASSVREMGWGGGGESGLDMGIAIRAHVGRVGPGC